MSGRYASIQLLSRFQAELDRLLQEVMVLPDGGIEMADWQPPVDIVETDLAVLILVELPGFAAADLTVEVQGARLLVAGVKQAPPAEHHCRFHRVERSRGRFGREIQLLWPVNSHLGSARLEDGVLRIEFPKIQDKRQEARRLPVEELREEDPP
jgi:HSP20 family protein